MTDQKNEKNSAPHHPTPSEQHILLMLLPFWTPLIPPMGISCLNTFLQGYGYHIKMIDANTAPQFRELYGNYFSILNEHIPENKKGNFFNVGHDVLKDHMMAHLNCTNDEVFIKLTEQLIAKHFFYDMKRLYVIELNRLIREFYILLDKYFRDILAAETPSVLGLSVFRGTLGASLFVAKIAKECHPHIKIIMGGGAFSQALAPGTSDFERFLASTPYIDHIIIGEGEVLFLKWLRGELTENQRVYSQADTHGQSLDIQAIAIPDFFNFELADYIHVPAYASRSCPFQCSFCAETVNWGRYRKKNIPLLIQQLIELYKKHSSQLIFMCDSLINPIISELSEELLKCDISIYWDAYLRADKPVCEIDNALLWRRGGFYRARIGVESGSANVLELMGKNMGPEQIKLAISTLASVGIKTSTMWVIGHPGETEKDFQQTLDLIEELKDDTFEAECNPFRYFLAGQVNSEEWAMGKPIGVYPDEVVNLVTLQTWALDGQPSREETYQRMNRFVQHCKRLGIPNPYSLHEIYQADERWKKLHENAVPSLAEFRETNFIEENKKVKKLIVAKNIVPEDENDFDF